MANKLYCKPGDRIVLDHMGYDPDPVPDGTMGTVELIDAQNTIHVKFDDGRCIGVIPGEDKFHILCERNFIYMVERKTPKGKKVEMTTSSYPKFKKYLENLVRNEARYGQTESKIEKIRELRQDLKSVDKWNHHISVEALSRISKKMWTNTGDKFLLRVYDDGRKIGSGTEK